MVPTGKHFIAGEWFHGSSLSVFHATNPSNLEELSPSYRDADFQQIDLAVSKAKEAFPFYRKTSPEERAQLLEAVSDSLQTHSSIILERARLESGLSAERLQFEFLRTVDQPLRFAKLLREGSWVDARIDLGDRFRQPRPKPDMRTMLQPIGPVAVFGASNFPLAISVMGTDTVSALAAGCPVIVKGHPAQPGTCELTALAVEKALKEFNFPKGVLSVIHGASHEVGSHLVKHPDLKAVAFTGSLVGGRSLMDLAATRPVPIPVFAEMGSLNPVFLLPNALETRCDAIVQGLVQSLTMDAGQFCTNPGVIVAMDGSGLDVFLSKLDEAISSELPRTMLHAGIHRNYLRRLKEMQEVAGVKLVSQSGYQTDKDLLLAHAHVLETDFDTWKRHPNLQEECFGPTTVVIRAKNTEEVLEFGQRMSGSLTATLHGTSEDFDNHTQLQEILETHVGRLVFNGFPTGVEIGYATHHGGPYPATSTQVHTSIGMAAIQRFVRPVCYQDCPHEQLPEPLQNLNHRQILRTVDGVPKRDSVED